MPILLFIAVHVFSCMSVMVMHGSVVLLSSRHLVLHSVRLLLLTLHGCAHCMHLKFILLTFFPKFLEKSMFSYDFGEILYYGRWRKKHERWTFESSHFISLVVVFYVIKFIRSLFRKLMQISNHTSFDFNLNGFSEITFKEQNSHLVLSSGNLVSESASLIFAHRLLRLQLGGQLAQLHLLRLQSFFRLQRIFF